MKTSLLERSDTAVETETSDTHPNRRRRFFAKVLGIGLIATAGTIGVSGTAQAAWDRVNSKPAVVVCYAGSSNGGYGPVRQIRAALVNNSNRTFRVEIYRVRNGNFTRVASNTVGAGRWGSHINGFASGVFADGMQVRWVPLSGGNGNGGHKNYSYSGLANIARC